MENRDEEFEELPFEWQMRIKQERKRMEALASHKEEVIDVSVDSSAFLDEIAKNKDVNDIKTKLFIEAEKLDAMKSTPEGKKLYHEFAKEYDWIRHVVSERGIDATEFAVEAVKRTVMGDFHRAAILGRSMQSHVDEFENILSYWKQALE